MIAGEIMCNYSVPCRERNMVIIERDKNFKPTVWCDPCLANIIKALNYGGVKTVASCCGHGVQDGSIVLSDGRELVILNKLRESKPK